MFQERSVAIIYVILHAYYSVSYVNLRRTPRYTPYTYWLLHRLFEAPKLMRVIAMWRLRLLP